MNAFWIYLTKSLSPVAANRLAAVVSIVAGLLLAVVLHYVLYRMGLPSKPFIYVAF